MPAIRETILAALHIRLRSLAATVLPERTPPTVLFMLRNAQLTLAEGAPLGKHLIATAHQQLLSFGRGARKRPGSYKVEQNYIAGERRRRIYDIPIAPEQMGPAMAELVRYINESTIRPLIRPAISHVESGLCTPSKTAMVGSAAC